MMSEYLKPQSPLQHKDGAFIYPLTTADQIILEDDTRLNAALDDINAKIGNINGNNIDLSEYAKTEYVDTKLSETIPVVSSEDNGKFMRVVNGVWSVVSLPNAEEASF